MVFAKTWEDFEIAAEAMLMENPDKCRYSMKYAHNKQQLVLKVTNNAKVSALTGRKFGSKFNEIPLQCIQYKTEVQPDLKKVEKFTSNVMNHLTNMD
jgi:signal recognition particle subunit SRP9